MAETNMVKIKLLKKASSKKQRETLKGMGLRRISSTSVLKDTPEIRGMIGKVSHLVAVERG
ncbi:MAG: 50S ribosomal protein L30 [Thermodesulfobacteriota bacterium]